jgi:hypothetical protein
VSTQIITTPSGLTVYFRGPDLSEGPLPSLFYFALSGEETLSLDPFNQPAAFLAEQPIRVFSSTLPLHGTGQKNTEAMLRWGEQITKGEDIFGEFLEKCCENLDFLLTEGIVIRSKVAAAGLSRGGFFATHFAALHSSISHVLGFAPLTTFATIKESEYLVANPLILKWDLQKAIPQLINKKVRYYIGNLDERVGTQECFDFIHRLSLEAKAKKVPSPTAELIISPSIGHKGHGTPPQIFREGTAWIAKELLTESGIL